MRKNEVKHWLILSAFVLFTVFAGCAGGDDDGGGGDLPPPDGGGGGGTSVVIAIASLTANPTTINADGTSTSTITAQVTGDGAAAPDGTVVWFSLPSGGIWGSLSAEAYAQGVSTSAGSASVILTSGTYPGTVTVTAVSGTDSETVEVEYAPVGTLTAWQYSATAYPSTVQVNGTSEVIVAVRDASGDLAPDGTEVTFTSDLLGSSIDETVDTFGGVAMATFTAGRWPSATGGATITIGAGTSSTTVSIAVLDLEVEAVSASPNAVFLLGISTVEAEIRDTAGSLAADGTEVTFTSDLLGSQITSSAETVGGLAQATFTAGSITGNATVTAQVGLTSSDTTTISVSTPARILAITSLSASPTSIEADGMSTSTITARVTEDGTTAPDGTVVWFSLPAGGYWGSLTSEAYAQGVSTSLGSASVTLTSGTYPATITVTAVSGSDSETVEVEYTAPSSMVAWNLTASASPSTIQIYGQSEVIVVVRDPSGSLAPDGTEVSFVSDLTGSIIAQTAKTAGGVATTTFAAGQWPSGGGGATVTVTAGTSSETVSIAVLDLAVQAVTPIPDAVPVFGTSTVEVEVRDSAGSLAKDGSVVRFTTNLLGTQITSSATTTGGLAEAEFTAGSTSGSATVTARVGMTSSDTATIDVGAAGVTISASSTPARIAIGATSLVEAEIRDSGGNLVPDGTLVTFSTNLVGAKITNDTTTESGLATATFTAGTKSGAAAITIKCGDTVDTSITITVVGQVASIEVYANPLTISVYGTSSIQAEVQDASGNPVANGTLVYFSTDMSSATLTESAETYNGQAQATFTAGSGYGTASVTAESGGISNSSLEITVLPPTVGSIEFTSATPVQVGVKGSGRAEVSTVVFTARDSHGNPAPDGTVVDFELFGPEGGEYIDPLQTTTANGQAITHLQSGTVAGPVIIEARIDINETPVDPSDDLTTSSIGMSIASGLPSQDHFSLALEAGSRNVSGLNCYGVVSELTAFISDRFSNFIADGTAVNFYTEAGGIDPTGWTGSGNGALTVELLTEDPQPRDVSPAESWDCPSAYSCLYPCTPEPYVEASTTVVTIGPHRIHNPRDGISTILAATIGEESFNDINGNGLYDVGEPFGDIAEPYLDANDNKKYDYAEPFTDGLGMDGQNWTIKINNNYDPPTPWLDIPNGKLGNNNIWDPGEQCFGHLEHPTNPYPYCEPSASNGYTVPAGCVCFPGEDFIRVNDNNQWDPAEFYVDYNENRRFDGPNGVWDSHTMIWTIHKQLWTGSSYTCNYFRVNTDDPCEICTVEVPGCEYPNGISVTNGGFNRIVMECYDENINPLDHRKMFATGQGLTPTPFQELIPDPFSQEHIYFRFDVYDDDPDTAEWNRCGFVPKIEFENDCIDGLIEFSLGQETGWCE